MRCWKKPGLMCRRPVAGSRIGGWRTITTSGPSGATAMRLTCRATASGCLACASLLRCLWCSIHANTCAFSGCLGSMLPTCVFLPPMPKPAFGCRVCQWWMEATCAGYTPATLGRNRCVSWGADEVCRGDLPGRVAAVRCLRPRSALCLHARRANVAGRRCRCRQSGRGFE